MLDGFFAHSVVVFIPPWNQNTLADLKNKVAKRIFNDKLSLFGRLNTSFFVAGMLFDSSLYDF